MKFTKPTPKTQLEALFLSQVDKDTPKHIKNNKIIDLNNNKQFEFILKKQQLYEYSDENKQGLDIWNWFNNYKEEAKISTAGIRGLQNPLYPWDTRYPLNLVGVMLATLGKIKVAEKLNTSLEKVAACEVRYNSKQYTELISRLQACYGIKTYVTDEYEPLPIFLVSFIIFMYDLYGGEYVTSSHAMSKKIATKDLNTQGSQYIPSESIEFVEELHKILNEIEKKGQYKICFSSFDDNFIDRKFLRSINNGVDLYVDYLKNGIATKSNIQLIDSYEGKIPVDCVGGSMKGTLLPILDRLDIGSKFDLLRSDEDPFNYETGKVIDENGKFFDWGCDTTIMKPDLKTLQVNTPVLDSINYKYILKNYPIGTTLLITDPDADRLIMSYIENSEKTEYLRKKGIVVNDLGDDRVLVMFTPNQSFLMTMDFQKNALQQCGLWDEYDWFVLKTTASQRSWDEWARNNNTPVVNTPVGFKELADSMQVVERYLKQNKGKDIYINDVFGNKIKLGKNPRLLFAGEESGGEIFGPSELIKSKAGRIAISMREKSAGESLILTAAMTSWIQKQKITPFEYLTEIFDRNKIHSRYEIRIDNKYYNESEPDINKLNLEKEEGIKIRINNDSYFLSLALGYRNNLLRLSDIQKILSETFPKLTFNDLADIKFVGDGTYLLFKYKCIEVRPSGTDAVNKAYAYGSDQWENIKYAKTFAEFDGTRSRLHKKLVDEKFYSNIKEYSFNLYTKYKQNQ